MGAEGGVNNVKYIPRSRRNKSSGLVFSIDANTTRWGNGRTQFYDTNVHTYNYWDIVSSGGQGGYSANGAASENNAGVDLDPWGRYAVIWKGEDNTISSNSDGGWNGPAGCVIDPNSEYRFTFWTKIASKGTGNGSGRLYFGLHGGNSSTTNAGVEHRTTLSNQTNPYFSYPSVSDSNLPEGKWFMNCQCVKPTGTSASWTHPDYRGYYLTDGTDLGHINGGNVGGGARWRSDGTRTRSRNYLYYSTDPTVSIHWYYPRIDLIDGTEPSVNQMLTTPIDNVYDHSKNGANLTPYPLSNPPTLVNGKYWEFDGSSQYLVGSNVTNMNVTTEVSIVAWINSDSLTQSGFIFEKGSVNTSYALFFEGTNNMTFRTKESGGTTYDLDVDVSNYMTVGKWHLIVATFDGTTRRFYIDGKERGSDITFSGKTIATNNNGISVGAYGGQDAKSYYFNGKISSIKVYKYSISPWQISYEYHQRKTSIRRL